MLDLVGSVETAQLPGGQLVVSAHGPIDERVATPFLDLLVPAAVDGAVVVLDLTDAHGLDDAALAVVGVAAQLVHDRGERLSVVTRPLVARRLDDAGFGAILDVHATLRAAIADD
jgi:anti-anti-sigma factor